MARQLIYTSAEHGLSAGRSGFCTVARHSDIRERLVSELERLSAFDRPPAGQPLSVIRTHRILTVGSDRYHILSCIQDAGPDYSGRTNHIAHHLICEESELTIAASPALVLLRFPWKERWTESSRYFDKAEEVDLSQYREPALAGGIWQELTGNPKHAELLHSAKARQGCYIAYAVGSEELLLAAFDESLGKLTFKNHEKKWQISFTTLLQPTDSSRDFSWRGCYVGSLIHQKAQASGENVFDLTQPDSFPVIPASTESVRSSVGPVRSITKSHAVSVSQQQQSRTILSSTRQPGKGLHVEEATTQKNRVLLIVAAIIIAVGIVVGCTVLLSTVFKAKPPTINNTGKAAVQISSISQPSQTRTNSLAVALTSPVTQSKTEPPSIQSATTSTVGQLPAVAPSAQPTPAMPSVQQLAVLPEQFNLLMGAPTYILVADQEKDIDISAISKKLGNLPISARFIVAEQRFESFPSHDIGKKSWNVGAAGIYYDQVMMPLLETDGTNHLKVTRQVAGHIKLSFDSNPRFSILLLNQDIVSRYGAPFSPIKIDRNWLIEDSVNDTIGVSNALIQQIQSVVFSGLNCGSVPMKLTAKNFQTKVPSLSFALKAFKDELEAEIKRNVDEVEVYRAKRVAAENKNAESLKALLEGDLSDFAEVMQDAGVMCQDSKKVAPPVKEKGHPKTGAQKDKALAPNCKFHTEKISRAEIWSDYCSFIQNIVDLVMTEWGVTSTAEIEVHKLIHDFRGNVAPMKKLPSVLITKVRQLPREDQAKLDPRPKRFDTTWTQFFTANTDKYAKIPDLLKSDPSNHQQFISLYSQNVTNQTIDLGHLPKCFIVVP